MIAKRFGRVRVAALAAALACFCLPAPAAADPAEEAYQTAASMAAALAEDNPAAFLRYFDSAMPGLGALRNKVRALIARAELSSSIDVLENSGDAGRRTLVLDWYLEAHSREVGQATERRRVRVTIVLNRAGKAWKAVSMDAGGLFD